jgi:hypothetical protein
MKNKTKLPAGIELTDDFKEMVNLLAVYTEAHNSLIALENDCNTELLEIIDEHKTDYAVLQESLTKAEAALELIALRHPEWFAQKQSIGTPYGTVKFHSGTKLEAANEEVSILLIRQKGMRAFDEAEENGEIVRAAIERGETVALPTTPVFDDAQFVRVKEELNLEALAGLTDAELGEFRIRRVPNKSFSVKPAKIDMGKAVKESVEQKEAA